MSQSDSAVASDGTPLADLEAELRELRAELASAKQAFRFIVNSCDAPHWTAARRWTIRDKALAASKGQY